MGDPTVLQQHKMYFDCFLLSPFIKSEEVLYQAYIIQKGHKHSGILSRPQIDTSTTPLSLIAKKVSETSGKREGEMDFHEYKLYQSESYCSRITK